MGDVQGLEKVNDICMKTMYVGTMDRIFTVLYGNNEFISLYYRATSWIWVNDLMVC
jgi:hypothetical protein